MGAGGWAGGGVRPRFCIGLAVLLLCNCAPLEVQEADTIIDFDKSQYADWERDPLFAHFNELWFISIIEGPGPPGGPDSAFFIPNARAVLQDIVERCNLGETIFQHQYDGYATLSIDDTDLSTEKIHCIRQFERQGLSLEMGENMRVLDDLRSKGILPPDDNHSASN